MKRHRSARGYRSILWKAALFVFIGAAAIDLRALAQDESSGSGDTSELDADAPVPDLPGHLPFTTWDDGPDAIPFDSLAPAEQDAVMAQAELSETNCGYDVAQKWSAYSHEMADLAAAETARRLAGLTGTDDIGVAP